jgi:hypothetical protein
MGGDDFSSHLSNSGQRTSDRSVTESARRGERQPGRKRCWQHMLAMQIRPAICQIDRFHV